MQAGIKPAYVKLTSLYTTQISSLTISHVGEWISQFNIIYMNFMSLLIVTYGGGWMIFHFSIV